VDDVGAVDTNATRVIKGQVSGQAGNGPRKFLMGSTQLSHHCLFRIATVILRRTRATKDWRTVKIGSSEF
jgi:hypothetical protein